MTRHKNAAEDKKWIVINYTFQTSLCLWKGILFQKHLKTHLFVVFPKIPKPIRVWKLHAYVHGWPMVVDMGVEEGRPFYPEGVKEI